MKPRSLPLLISILFAAIFGSNSHAGDTRIIVQHDASEGSCGPSAISNWLIHGSDDTLKLFDNFPGEDDPSRVLYLIQEFASGPSAVLSNKKLLRYNNGMHPYM